MKRGGSWNNNARNCRSANRNNNAPDNRNNNLGFRVLAARRWSRSARRRTERSPDPDYSGQIHLSRGKASSTRWTLCERLAASDMRLHRITSGSHSQR